MEPSAIVLSRKRKEGGRRQTERAKERSQAERKKDEPELEGLGGFGRGGGAVGRADGFSDSRGDGRLCVFDGCCRSFVLLRAIYFRLLMTWAAVRRHR